ncbi:Uncharacterised protein [Serratia entomophila]|uniref:hypothetical protein n=1 Tax=Serratia entomophila TaxID=42906 RepID=UPI001F1D47BE|nr:hypothetical protein [Serratia entomophila]UIW19285.1 hypothetical protein KHA73_04860 [Serratia entomophila]UIW19468.1 hypothetical protein KHA73_05825 [Serratia entomophila]CAI0804208.1 Uncharacterised protein [Serratia entomophila]CAI0820372.1 Uncharacterised protein [Serratia entomophila]CAI0823526.1 Uncharacterised protein [Serratia entomophila]
MSRRLEILRVSLSKKEALFNEKLQHHFDTVAQANGQPLNDKRNGRATLDKWDKQSDSLRALDSSIKRTKEAIEREELKITLVESVSLPDYIQSAISDGLITQWRKFPRFFFVTGVTSGRIVLDEKTGLIAHRYLSKVPKEEYPIFRDVFNKLNQISKDQIKCT